MINEVVIANIKNLIDAMGVQEDLTPEKSIFQVSIGRKENKYGWHFSVFEGTCLFKRGLYTGDVVIDWNEEFKFKEKSRKQILKETTPDFEINFKTEEKWNIFIEKCLAYSAGSGKMPFAKGSKRRGSKCEGKFFSQLLTYTVILLAGGKLPFDIAEGEDNDKTAARMILNAIPEGINYLAKNGNEDFMAFLSGSRKSYFFEVKNADVSTWFTVQDGIGKVTANQGTRLPAFCGACFDDYKNVIDWFCSENNLPDEVYSFRGAATYGNPQNTDEIKKNFTDTVNKAKKIIKIS